ncbi:ectoine utilization protein EutC [Aureimonas altamirensis]|uniref:ectoine utilization protein EutC n=1 Tax=Aureimonas altamirensis TaxID=370622 RepID=UPI00301B3A8E
MPDMLILTEPDLRTLVPLDINAIDTVERAFRALAEEAVVMPPILRLDVAEHNGEVDVKTAYVPGIDGFAIKISPGFFDNPKLGLPSVNGMMVLLSARTGLVQALLLDNGYLTDIRTAAAGAVAARHLARADASHATIFGAGMQARLQLRALAMVRPLQGATIWARDAARAEAAAAEMTEAIGLPVEAARDPQEAARRADIIVTTTPSRSPILQRGWVRPGTHVTAMGSDAEHKNEVDPTLVAAARYVADRLAQTRILGELHHAIAAGLVAADAPFPELGAVVAGQAPGRADAHSITFADLTGTGVQDTAIATLAHARAKSAGVGTRFTS